MGLSLLCRYGARRAALLPVLCDQSQIRHPGESRDLVRLYSRAIA